MHFLGEIATDTFVLAVCFLFRVYYEVDNVCIGKQVSLINGGCHVKGPFCT